MSDETASSDPSATPNEGTKPRKGGLGRGLGALIPSAPLGKPTGKGHFWSVLDSPPTVDPANVPSVIGRPGPAPATEHPTTDVSRETSAPAPAVSGDDADHQAVETPAAAETLSAPHDAAAEDGTQIADTASDTTDSGHLAGRPGPGAIESDPQTSDSGNSEATESDLADAPAVLIEVDPVLVDPNPKNPRQVFDDDELAELAESVAEFGLLQPIVVRRSPEQDDRFELVMGERRLRAARIAEVAAIPAILRQTDDDAMLRDALLENIHRVQLHPLEEAAAYQQLIDEFGVTHDELATRIKRSRPVISNTIRLLKLPVRVQNRVAAGVISGSHARALLGLPTPDEQEALATRIVAEGLSVRATEEAVALAASEPTARQAPRRRKITAPALAGLAERLSDHFDTRALVQLGRTKGKIVVEFASIDDLERIIAMMAPPLATSRLSDELTAEAEQPSADPAL